MSSRFTAIRQHLLLSLLSSYLHNSDQIIESSAHKLIYPMVEAEYKVLLKGTGSYGSAESLLASFPGTRFAPGMSNAWCANKALSFAVLDDFISWTTHVILP